MNCQTLAKVSGILLVIMIIGCGKSHKSPTGPDEIPEPVPAAPSALSLTVASTSQINLSWSDNANNETGFLVERAPGGTTTFSQIAQLGANSTSYQSTALTAATSYSYRVRAYNAAGNSPYSNVASATTQAAISSLIVKNSSSHPIVSLRVNGYELIGSEAQSIMPGYSRTYQVAPGIHQFEIWNGWWEYGQTRTLYSLSGSYTQPMSGSYQLTYKDPSIYSLLTNFNTSGYADWCGEYWVGLDFHIACFRFFKDGTYRFYTDGTQRASGTYQLVNYGSNFITSFTIGQFEGLLEELHGSFFMDNGPADFRTIKYTLQF